MGKQYGSWPIQVCTEAGISIPSADNSSLMFKMPKLMITFVQKPFPGRGSQANKNYCNCFQNIHASEKIQIGSKSFVKK